MLFQKQLSLLTIKQRKVERQINCFTAVTSGTRYFSNKLFAFGDHGFTRSRLSFMYIAIVERSRCRRREAANGSRVEMRRELVDVISLSSIDPDTTRRCLVSNEHIVRRAVAVPLERGCQRQPSGSARRGLVDECTVSPSFVCCFVSKQGCTCVFYGQTLLLTIKVLCQQQMLVLRIKGFMYTTYRGG